MEKKRAAIARMAILSALAIFLLWRGSAPSSYEDCVQKNIKNAHTDRAAMLVHSSCSRQFPRTYSEQEVFGGSVK